MPEPTSFMAPDKKKEMLKTIDVLSFFHESTLERLAQESKEIPLESEVVLFKEGDPDRPRGGNIDPSGWKTFDHHAAGNLLR